MKKTTRQQLIYGAVGLSIVLIAGGVYYWWNKNKDEPIVQLGSGSSAAKSKYPVSPGSRGEHVKPLQRKINLLMPSPFLPLKVDGIYGENTKAAALKYLGKTRFSKAEIEKMQT